MPNGSLLHSTGDTPTGTQIIDLPWGNTHFSLCFFQRHIIHIVSLQYGFYYISFVRRIQGCKWGAKPLCQKHYVALRPLLFYPKNTLPAASDRAGCCHGHGLGLHPPAAAISLHAYPDNTGHRSAWPASLAEPSQRHRAAPAAAFPPKHFRCLGLHQDRIFNAVVAVQGVVRLIAIHPPVISSFRTLSGSDRLQHIFCYFYKVIIL